MGGTSDPSERRSVKDVPCIPDAGVFTAPADLAGERLGLTTKIPGTAFIASSFARRNWNFETEPVPALNGRRLRWFQGHPRWLDQLRPKPSGTSAFRSSTTVDPNPLEIY